MAGMPTIKLARPIESLKVIQSPTIVVDMPGDVARRLCEQDALAELESQKQQYAAGDCKRSKQWRQNCIGI